MVDEDGRAVCDEGPGDCFGIEGDVVVAEDGVAVRSCEGRQDFSASMDGMTAGDEGERTVGDEVAGKEDQIGGEGVDLLDDAFEEEGLGELVEVNVAELGDAEAVKRGGEIVNVEGTWDDVDFMARYLAGVEGESGGGGSSGDEEFSAGDLLRGGGGDTGHSS